ILTDRVFKCSAGSQPVVGKASYITSDRCNSFVLEIFLNMFYEIFIQNSVAVCSDKDITTYKFEPIFLGVAFVSGSDGNGDNSNLSSKSRENLAGAIGTTIINNQNFIWFS